MAEETKNIKILLVEDNYDDITLIERALKEAKVRNKLWIVRDGQEAVDFLWRKGQYKNPATAPTPNLIILDINLPKMNGLEVLKRIKQDRQLKTIPTVMLTVSRDDKDVTRSYDFGCNSFIQKPVRFEKFVEAVKDLNIYWGSLNIDSSD